MGEESPELEIMTEQQVFNKAVTGVLGQGEPSITDDESSACVYRGPRGLKCAVGFLIKDREYCSQMEEVPVMDVIGMVPSLKKRLRDHVSLLDSIQRAHDAASVNYDFLTHFCGRVVNVANKYNLKLTWVKNHPNWRQHA
jgi:hypothetical protein